MSLAHRVSSFAPHHARLQDELRALGESERRLPDAEELVRDLRAQLVRAEKQLKTAQNAQRLAHFEYDDIKLSPFRKFSYRATGRAAQWAAITSKAEQDYADTIERVKDAQGYLDALKAALNEAQDNVKVTQGDITRCKRIQEELADMYDRVFDGPTPEVPQQEVLNWAFHTADAERQRLQAALAHQTQALEMLRFAEDAVKQCVSKMEECRKASSADLWTSRDSVEAIKYASLSAARSFALEFASRFAQARRAHTEVGVAPDIALPMPSTTGLIFKNIITESIQHQNIIDGLGSAQSARRAVEAEIRRAQTRVECAQDVAAPAEIAYQRARDELTLFRRTAFETLAVQSASVPPGYDEVHAVTPPAAVSDSGQIRTVVSPEMVAHWSSANPYSALISLPYNAS